MKHTSLFNDDNLDERELFLRGKIYQHCCTVLVFLLVFNIILKNFFMLPPIDSYIILAIALVVLDIEMIYYEIYPVSFKTQRSIFFVLGITGFLLIVLSSYHILIEQYPMFNQNTLSEYGINLIVGICFALILFAYYIRLRYNKKHNLDIE